MKTHLTTEEVYDLAYEKLDVSNIKVDKEIELGEMLGLEYDENNETYFNPEICTSCRSTGYDKRSRCMDCEGSGIKPNN